MLVKNPSPNGVSCPSEHAGNGPHGKINLRQSRLVDLHDTGRHEDGDGRLETGGQHRRGMQHRVVPSHVQTGWPGWVRRCGLARWQHPQGPGFGGAGPTRYPGSPGVCVTGWEAHRGNIGTHTHTEHKT